MKRIYVGNLPASVSDQELESIFNTYGSVKTAHVIKDKMTGESRGFGFVEMAQDEDGDNAINALNGFEVQGQKMRVSEARPRREFGSAPDRRFGGGGYGRREGGSTGTGTGGGFRRRSSYDNGGGFGGNRGGGSRYE